MSFWTSSKFEPKTKSRFVVNLGGNFFITVKSVSKPKLTIESQEYRMINHFYKFPGLAKWEPIEITFVDVYGEIQGEGKYNGTELTNTAAYLAGLANRIGYVGNDLESFDENASSFSRKFKSPNLHSITKDDSSAAFSSGNGGDAIIAIQQLNSDGKVIEEWTLHNPTIKSLEWGDLQYGSDDLVEYKLSLDYDYAKFSGKKDPYDPKQGKEGNIYN
jgi:hypothetical protein